MRSSQVGNVDGSDNDAADNPANDSGHTVQELDSAGVVQRKLLFHPSFDSGDSVGADSARDNTDQEGNGQVVHQVTASTDSHSSGQGGVLNHESV